MPPDPLRLANHPNSDDPVPDGRCDVDPSAPTTTQRGVCAVCNYVRDHQTWKRCEVHGTPLVTKSVQTYVGEAKAEVFAAFFPHTEFPDPTLCVFDPSALPTVQRGVCAVCNHVVQHWNWEQGAPAEL